MRLQVLPNRASEYNMPYFRFWKDLRNWNFEFLINFSFLLRCSKHLENVDTIENVLTSWQFSFFL